MEVARQCWSVHCHIYALLLLTQDINCLSSSFLDWLILFRWNSPSSMNILLRLGHPSWDIRSLRTFHTQKEKYDSWTLHGYMLAGMFLIIVEINEETNDVPVRLQLSLCHICQVPHPIHGEKHAGKNNNYYVCWKYRRTNDGMTLPEPTLISSDWT